MGNILKIKNGNEWQSIPAIVGPQGPAGQNGATGAAGPGVASGGTTGQVQKKKSNTDYDTEWGSIPSPLPSGGSASQVLAKNSNNTALTWAGYAVPGGGSQGQVLQKSSNVTGATSWGGYSVPAGGSTGQVLKKSSDTDGATSWAGYAVPTGGSTNQILAKNSNTNGDLKWINNNSATFPTGGSASQVLRRNGVNSGLEWAGYAVPTGGLKGQFLCKNSDSNGNTNWVDLPLRVTLYIDENSNIPGEYLIQHASEEIYDDPYEICVAFSQGKLMVIENFANTFDENDYGSDGYICDAGTGTVDDNGISRSFTFLKVKCIKQNGVEIEKYFAGYEDDTYGYSVRDVTDQFQSGSSLPSGGTAGQFLKKTANGEEWADVNQVPSQTGSGGMFLYVNSSGNIVWQYNNVQLLIEEDSVTGNPVFAITNIDDVVNAYRNGQRIIVDYRYANGSEDDNPYIMNGINAINTNDVYTYLTQIQRLNSDGTWDVKQYLFSFNDNNSRWEGIEQTIPSAPSIPEASGVSF